MGRSQEFDTGYRMSHRPPDSDYGAGLHEVDKVFPGVHERPELYSFGDEYTPSLQVAKQVRGNPDAQVTIYRAVPHGTSDINTGDWVSTSLPYAQQHGMHPTDPSKDWPVLSARVSAKHVVTGGDSITEYGYVGPSLKGLK